MHDDNIAAAARAVKQKKNEISNKKEQTSATKKNKRDAKNDERAWLHGGI